MGKRYFSEQEVRDLVWGSEVDTIEGEDRRWSRTNTSVVEADDGKLYMVDWEEGLTEMQDNEYYAGLYPEVKKVTYEKVITVTDWTNVD